MDPRNLSAFQIDVLGEVGSIGAGHAATALSQLLGAEVNIDVPDTRLLPVSEVPMVFGGAENLVGAVYTRLLGDLAGALLFILPRDQLLALADLLRSREPGTAKSLGTAEEGLVVHASAVLQAAYLSAIARLTELSVLPGPSQFAFDMMGGILDFVTAEIGMKVESALLIVTRFVSSETIVDGALFFLPDPDSLDVLLGRLGAV
ncbi:MAG: CheY-P-specific phosphatase CheC [Actinobacteria bacterium]|nr:CheY-P-specific phosphatase CheC [Actinomycetota bacterium]